MKLSSPTPVDPALIPYTVTIVLPDFKRIQAEHPDGPQDATETMALSCTAHALYSLGKFGGHFLQMYFDQNEPFAGHVKDRKNNGRFKRDSLERGLDLDRVLHVTEMNMRYVPALQAADLLAYCVGNRSRIRFRWQDEILKMDRHEEWYDYATLSRNLNLELHALNVSRYKFPPRKPTR